MTIPLLSVFDVGKCVLQALIANIALVLDHTNISAAQTRGQCRMNSKDYIGAVADFEVAEKGSESQRQVQTLIPIHL